MPAHAVPAQQRKTHAAWRQAHSLPVHRGDPSQSLVWRLSPAAQSAFRHSDRGKHPRPQAVRRRHDDLSLSLGVRGRRRHAHLQGQGLSVHARRLAHRLRRHLDDAGLRRSLQPPRPLPVLRPLDSGYGQPRHHRQGERRTAKSGSRTATESSCGSTPRRRGSRSARDATSFTSSCRNNACSRAQREKAN